MKPNGYLLALHRRLNLTRPRFEKLHSFYEGDWQKAYQAPLKDWAQTGIDKRSIEKFFRTPETLSPAEEQALMQACGAQIVTSGDEHYPDLWHNIAQSPALFFYRGNGENFNTKSIAVVGARKMTDYGEHVFSSVLKPVFEHRITVVSGLAFGVDATAHKLALVCKTPTIAVLGNGIDDVYPKQNSKLAQQILESGGTIVSEYLPHTEARPEYFPQRNRLVTGLCEATIVVEAALKSGSLISARLANDMGRQVWAVPGDIFKSSSAGCNQLLFQGEAQALTEAKYLLESLNIDSALVLQKLNLSSEEKEIVGYLRQQGSSDLERLIDSISLNATEVSVPLLSLELKGVIKTNGNLVYLC